MSEERQDGDGAAPGSGEPAAPGPFDHPFFLPTLLFAFAAWFGFDGWFNEHIEAVSFNRYGFVVLLSAGAYYTLDNFVRTPYLLPAFLLGGALVLGCKGWLIEPNEQQLFDRIAAIALLSAALYLVVQIYVQSPFLLPALLFAGAAVLAALAFTGEEQAHDGWIRWSSYALAAAGALLTLLALWRSRGSAPPAGA